MKSAIHKPSSNDRQGGRKKTNFDAYLEEQMKAPAFARRFRQASAAAALYGHTARLYSKSEHMNALAQLVCSRVRAEIFRVLFGLGPDELHLREIQRQTGFAIGTVRQDIGKLVKMGLVTRRQDGNRVCYAANRRHPLHAELRQLVLKTVGLADVLAAALKPDGIRCAFVFGSVAAGNAKPESDIDLMVIGNIGLRRLCVLLSGVGGATGSDADELIEFVESLEKDVLTWLRAQHPNLAPPVGPAKQ